MARSLSPLLRASLLGASLCCAGAPAAAGLDDPFDVAALHAGVPCRAHDAQAPLSLAAAVDLALCNNPQTRLAWANARAQAAQVGIARGAWLPSLSASASRSANRTEAGATLAYNQTAGTLTASYLLYDFGGREAALANASELLAALAATQDATLQNVFLAAVQAYYQWWAADAAIAAAREAERAGTESLKAAEARYRIGTGTPADKLQAQTAASQAQLSRIQAEGNAKAALGALANALGLDAHRAPALAPPAEAAPAAGFERGIDELIATAKRSRPDLAAAEALVRAARSGIEVARSSGMPSIALTAANNYSDAGAATPTRGTSLGVAVTIPLFAGFNTTYRIRAAEAQLEARSAQRDQLDKQVSLEVWRSYYALLTGTEAVRAAADLVAAAAASEQVASGRYRAGVGGILDVLNAQSALASARRQNIQALLDWRIAKVALAQAIGQLDFSQIDGGKP